MQKAIFLFSLLLFFSLSCFGMEEKNDNVLIASPDDIMCEIAGSLVSRSIDDSTSLVGMLKDLASFACTSKENYARATSNFVTERFKKSISTIAYDIIFLEASTAIRSKYLPRIIERIKLLDQSKSVVWKNPETIKQLVEEDGLSPNFLFIKKTKKGIRRSSLLYKAANTFNIELIDWLLEKGADSKILIDGKDALAFAIDNFPTIAIHILRTNDFIKFSSKVKYTISILNGCFDLSQKQRDIYRELFGLLIHKGFDPNYMFGNAYGGLKKSKSLLLWAYRVEREDSEPNLVEVLLQKGANPDLPACYVSSKEKFSFRALIERDLRLSKNKACLTKKIAALINKYAPKKKKKALVRRR